MKNKEKVKILLIILISIALITTWYSAFEMIHLNERIETLQQRVNELEKEINHKSRGWGY